MIEASFYFCRHGRTAGNDLNIYRGWSNADFAQLDADGKDDAREAGIFLKGTGVSFPFILTDDLERTGETAKIIADILGVKEVMTDKRLRPLNMGDWTGEDKSKHPVEEYLRAPSKKIPGGESMNEFNTRQAKIFDVVLETINKIKKPILIIGHGSNVCFLYNHVNARKDNVPAIGYEGLTDPGGVLMFTKDGITPLTKSRKVATPLYKDGTPLSGFVTDEENVPPRECWNCVSYSRDSIKSGSCDNPIVRIDPQLQDRKTDDNRILVGDRDCCDHFRNAIKVT